LRVDVSKKKKKSLSENSQKGKKIKKKRKKTGIDGTGRHENTVQNEKKNHLENWREKKLAKYKN